MRRYPVDRRITVPSHIPFGGADTNARYGRHAGDDSANAVGTPVYAPTSGTVTPYTNGRAHGNVVEIFDGSHYPHVFHLSERLVRPGDRVTVGQLIGRSGNTGLSTGPHVHFGVSTKSVPNTTSFNDFIDPLRWIREGAEEMIQDTDANYQEWRQYGWFIRGRELSREEFRISAVNQTWQRAMQILATGDEAKATQDAQQLGLLAIKDNWQGQIKSLLAEVETLKAQLSQTTTDDKAKALKTALIEFLEAA